MRPAAPSEHLVRQRLRTLTRSLPLARQGDAQSLHQARVATRRLRETLPLVTSNNRHRKLQRIVRRITRALGPVRELDVALQVLSELDQAVDVPRQATTHLQQAIGDERRRLQAEMIKKLDRCDLDKLQKRAIAAARKQAERAGNLRRGSAERVAPARRRAARRAERLRSAMDNAAAIYLPDRLHEVRIAVKKMRYSLELLREVGGLRGNRAPAASQSSGRGMMARLRTLKKAQDLLGRMHDLEILIARTRGAQGSPSVRNLKLSAEMDRLVRHLETECRQLHGQYIVLRPKLVAICDQTIAQHLRLSARAA